MYYFWYEYLIVNYMILLLKCFQILQFKSDLKRFI